MFPGAGLREGFVHNEKFSFRHNSLDLNTSIGTNKSKNGTTEILYLKIKVSILRSMTHSLESGLALTRQVSLKSLLLLFFLSHVFPSASLQNSPVTVQLIHGLLRYIKWLGFSFKPFLSFFYYILGRKENVACY